MLTRLAVRTARAQATRNLHRFYTPVTPSITGVPVLPSLLVAFVVGSSAAYCASTKAEAESSPGKEPNSIFDFEVLKIDGTVQSLSDYKGKVCLVVNVASK